MVGTFSTLSIGMIFYQPFPTYMGLIEWMWLCLRSAHVVLDISSTSEMISRGVSYSPF